MCRRRKGGRCTKGTAGKLNFKTNVHQDGVVNRRGINRLESETLIIRFIILIYEVKDLVMALNIKNEHYTIAACTR